MESQTARPEVTIHRVYDTPLPQTGRRFLVDRLWPRGIRSDDLALDGWLKDVAPSDALRKWFAHEPAKWDEFRERYAAELENRPQAWKPLLDAAREGSVALLYSARDEQHNNAVALREFLLRKL